MTGELSNPERLWAKIEVVGDCWIWTAAAKLGGYGRVFAGGRNRLAHRVVYEHLVGELQGPIDHLCRTTACVNPDHLELVTIRENNLRRYGATENRCQYGHIGQIKRLPSGGRRCRVCAAERMRRFRAKVKT